MREKNIKITGEKGAMNELALFAGAGGGILGGQLLGWRTVCAVEIEPYPASVLMQRQNDGLLAPFPIWDDVCTFDGRPWRGIVDVVSGGFPCQDISAAGKGAGIDGERSGLWAEFARIICEIQPRYAFIENSPMLTLRGLDRVLCDLAQMGFNAKWHKHTHKHTRLICPIILLFGRAIIRFLACVCVRVCVRVCACVCVRPCVCVTVCQRPHVRA